MNWLMVIAGLATMWAAGLLAVTTGNAVWLLLLLPATVVVVAGVLMEKNNG